MKFLNLKRRTILKLINDKKLKAFKVGKQWRISSVEFEKFINATND